MRRARVIIEKDEVGFSAFIDGIDSTIIGEGVNVAEAKADLENSYKEVLASYIENGEAIPEELQELSFDYKYDISALFNAFDFINVSKFAQRIGVSPSLMRHYKGGDTYISDNQAKRIESGLHQLARELLSVTL
jgi:predicted RNase H-like HicB family nuclease